MSIEVRFPQYTGTICLGTRVLVHMSYNRTDFYKYIVEMIPSRVRILTQTMMCQNMTPKFETAGAFRTLWR